TCFQVRTIPSKVRARFKLGKLVDRRRILALVIVLNLQTDHPSCIPRRACIQLELFWVAPVAALCYQCGSAASDAIRMNFRRRSGTFLPAIKALLKCGTRLP